MNRVLFIACFFFLSERAEEDTNPIIYDNVQELVMFQYFSEFKPSILMK